MAENMYTVRGFVMLGENGVKVPFVLGTYYIC